MSNQETKEFLDRCAMLQQDKMATQNGSVITNEAYVPPMLSSLDVDQIIAHGGCSPEPCSSPSTTVAAVTLGVAGVA